jgi:mannose-1-phosphate guanylyltransferase
VQNLNKVKVLLLAAGLGTRLSPLTDEWPKCLMPIGERPLLEYWLETLYSTNVKEVLVNLHHHSEIVQEFLNRPRFEGWVSSVYEESLLGTAGTIRANKVYFQGCTTLLVHADNWCQCEFADFLNYHNNHRPKNCLITMMTFESPTPETCGIVETDFEGVVFAFHEKKKNPPGNKANGAVYLLEPEVLSWIDEYPDISDFSTEVLPHFLGKIASWNNNGIHSDIGALPMLHLAQSDPKPVSCWPEIDSWQKEFLNNPIHQQIEPVVF